MSFSVTDPLILSPSRFCEVGRPIGVHHDAQGRWTAIASEFEPLYWPGRAIYGGHRLRHRLSLYTADCRGRIAVFDSARFPVNTVAFHPTEPLLAIGTGSYDGGYLFEGELFLWNPYSGETRELLGESREVVASRFTDEKELVVLLRPRDEEEFEDTDPFDTYIGLKLSDLCPYTELDLRARGFDPRLVNLPPVRPEELGFDQSFSNPERMVSIFFTNLSDFHERHRVWDVMWLSSQELLAVHDTCWYERWGTQGNMYDSVEGKGHGVQLFSARDEAIVHILERGNLSLGERDKSSLLSLDGHYVGRFDHAYSFSSDESGRLLGRDVGDLLGDPRPRKDIVLSPQGDVILSADLGHYDCFNHYVRIDGDNCLWFLRATPPTSHEQKVLCRIDHDGIIEEPIPWDTKHAHFMNGAAVLHNGSIVRSYEIYDRSPQNIRAYIELQRNVGRLSTKRSQGWRREVGALVTDMVVTCDGRLIYALTDGRVGILDHHTGGVLAEEHATIDGVPTVVQSLGVHRQQLAGGTICGNVILYDLTS